MNWKFWRRRPDLRGPRIPIIWERAPLPIRPLCEGIPPFEIAIEGRYALGPKQAQYLRGEWLSDPRG